MRRICPVLLTFVVILFISGTAFSASEGTIVIAQGVDPGTLDPQDHYETPAFNVLLNIYETLVVRDDEMKLMPLLATSWRLINDTTWEFTLRKGVKFQNGRTSTPRPSNSAWKGSPTARTSLNRRHS